MYHVHHCLYFNMRFQTWCCLTQSIFSVILSSLCWFARNNLLLDPFPWDSYAYFYRPTHVTHFYPRLRRCLATDATCEKPPSLTAARSFIERITCNIVDSMRTKAFFRFSI